MRIFVNNSKLLYFSFLFQIPLVFIEVSETKHSIITGKVINLGEMFLFERFLQYSRNLSLREKPSNSYNTDGSNSSPLPTPYDPSHFPLCG